MKYVEVDLESRPLRVQQKNLLTWTREMSEDLKMYHGLNIEDELSRMLGKEILKERCKMRKKSINKIFNL